MLTSPDLQQQPMSAPQGTSAPEADGPDVSKLREQFENYATVKADEIEEQRLSWRYYYAKQFTKKQMAVYEDRGQPAITFDRTGRKIDGLVGVVRKLRTDPKAFPRTQNQEEGAEVATQTIRTIMDGARFEDIEAEQALNAAVHGIAVAAQTLETGDHGDPDTSWEGQDPRTFFYDPRSVKPDFSDARYMGTYKWASEDEILEIVPDAELSGSDEGSNFTSFDNDRDILWRDTRKRYRLVDHWWIDRGMWRWCLHVGNVVLQSGETPFFNDKKQSLCKYKAYSCFIDDEGVHIGFIRRLRGPQDAMNQHRSKALWIMNTRQLKIKQGVAEAMGGIENVRKQAARADGVLVYPNIKDDIEIIQPQQEFLQQTQYYEDAKQEIETFGPNQALLGDLGQGASGRAYAMAQQAGLAELGPFLKNHRMWKLGIYQQSWWAAQKYWTAERFIRVTDDQGLAQFMKVNGLEMHPETMMPTLVNALGSINVDIVIDEGPHTETVMGDVNDTLMALAQNKVPVPPAVFIETSNLPGSEKKKLIGMLTQPDPAKEAATKLELEGKQAENAKTHSEAMLNVARAHAEGQPDAPAQQQAQEPELPMQIQIAQAAADIRETTASAAQKEAAARKLDAERIMAPMSFMHDVISSNKDRDAQAKAAASRPKPTQ
jgi:hypothetical protein